MIESSTEKLPAYLRRYSTHHDYEKYTPRDHAAWRYIMRQSRSFFKNTAVSIYLDGLKKTGIPLDRIPKITEMDLALQEFGWGAVAVCGFIPPIAFLDLQARGILPIATDMRSIEHISYTPAPDIVHEAAGHAPIIADPKYRDYLRQYAEMANKTIMSLDDLNLYEAIRVLSDIKENPDTRPDEIVAAQKNLDAAVASMSYVSEATKVSRMAWWTVEYGLVGPLSSPKIYGAGLLSSVGESQSCLSSHVRKIPLTVKCIETTYDITEPQPQLFVATDMDHLRTVLVELQNKLSYKIGGIHGLEESRKSSTVNTVVLNNGVEISGQLSRYIGAVGDPEEVQFIAFQGPVQLCKAGKQLDQQGRLRHPQGFSMPMGRWRKLPDRSPAELSDSELSALGLVTEKKSRLEFVNGFIVNGELLRIVRENGKILYLTWKNCTVTRGDQCFFNPSWGEFDMAVADRVVSVYGGPSDKESYGDYNMGGVSTQPGRTSPFTADEKDQFQCYSEIRKMRPQKSSLQTTSDHVLSHHSSEWLLNLELLESVNLGCLPPKLSAMYQERLTSLLAKADPVTASLIRKGIELSNVPD